MGVLIAAALAAAGVAPPIDWGARLADDVRRFRAVVLDSHPGPVDKANPRFRATLDAAVARALRRARRTRSLPAYYWALNELEAAFDDGHLSIYGSPALVEAHRADLRWPGFAARYDRGAYRVFFSEEAQAPVGARLLSCDGRSADAVAADRLGRFVGRWMLPATREREAPWLLMPPDNPWLGRLRRCAFDVDGARRSVTLGWRPIAAERRVGLRAAALKRYRAPIGVERLADGSWWIGLGSFESDPATPAGRELTATVAAVAGQAEAIRRAPRVVFDLRGNGGGSSNWIARMAGAIWGEGAVAARERRSTVEWRVSDGNIAELRTYRRTFAAQRATDPVPYRWASAILAGLEAARARGDATWTEPPEPAPAATGATHQVDARALVLTDGVCASACLDAVDLLTDLGAEQVGRETSADTQYMEVRELTLPDGTRIGVPMKVYRGRRRGPNVPATPRRAWTGAIDDTAAIRRWIAGT